MRGSPNAVLAENADGLDRLDRAVLRFWDAQSFASERCASSANGVGLVGFSVPTSLLTIRPPDLKDGDLFATQVLRETGTV